MPRRRRCCDSPLLSSRQCCIFWWSCEEVHAFCCTFKCRVRAFKGIICLLLISGSGSGNALEVMVGFTLPGWGPVFFFKQLLSAVMTDTLVEEEHTCVTRLWIKPWLQGLFYLLLWMQKKKKTVPMETSVTFSGNHCSRRRWTTLPNNLCVRSTLQPCLS